MHLARAGTAISLGVTLERLLDPQSVPDTLMESLLVLLAGEVTVPTVEESAARQKQRSRARTVPA